MNINEIELNLSILASQDAHIYYFDIRNFSLYVEQFYCLLSNEEKTNAHSFFYKKDEERYILARGMLRKLLSNYLEISCEQINFGYNKYGRPYLLNSNAVQFNVSHSKDIVLFGIAKHYLIGVDLECIDKNLEFDAISERFFHKNEHDILRKFDMPKKREVFFNFWVIKEAFAKAIGLGLNYNIANIEVSLTEENKYRIAVLHDPNETLLNWSLFSLDIKPDYALAIAIKGPSPTILINKIEL